MKLCISLIMLFIFSAPVSACGFRLADGKLLKCGMPRIEVLALAGQPEFKDIETLGVDSGEPVSGETVETWSYRLKADMGGEYLVSVTLTAGKVTAINRKQMGRL